MLARFRYLTSTLGLATWVTICGSQALGPALAVAQEPLSGSRASSETPSLSETQPRSSDGPSMSIVQDPKLADEAWAYLDALIVEDHERASSFLTAESRYQDFTIEIFDRDMVDLKGARAILKYWRDSAEAAGTIEARFDAEQHFVAGPNVYFIGIGRVKNLGATWGLPQKEVDFTFTQISHIRMVEGKVTYHADHVDYGDAFEQMKGYMNDAGLDVERLTGAGEAGPASPESKSKNDHR